MCDGSMPATTSKQSEIKLSDIEKSLLENIKQKEQQPETDQEIISD